MAKAANKSITEVVRDLLAEGLKQHERKHSSLLAKKLLTLVETVEKEGWVGPRDLAENHIVYFVKQAVA